MGRQALAGERPTLVRQGAFAGAFRLPVAAMADPEEQGQ